MQPEWLSRTTLDLDDDDQSSISVPHLHFVGQSSTGPIEKKTIVG